MATMSDVSIINWNKAEAKPVASGLESIQSLNHNQASIRILNPNRP